MRKKPIRVLPTGKEWLSIACALITVQIVYLRDLWTSAPYDEVCDASGYISLANRVLDHGLFNADAFSPLRTYGYPLFLSALQVVARVTSVPVRLLAAEFQILLYLLAAWLLRNEVRRVARRSAEWLFVALCVNVFVVIYAAETLTESLSVTLALLLAACWLWSVRVFRSPKWMLAGAVGGLVAGSAVMIRPANLFLPVVWLLSQSILAARRRQRASLVIRRRVLTMVLATISILVPWVPQFYSNVKFARVATPLVVVDLGTFQISTGIAALKYVTARPPIPTVKVFYLNPFGKTGRIDPVRPIRWYWENPAAGLVTLFLHAFALVDQDFIFPYVIDLAPAYRIPTSVLNHLMVGVGAYGLWVWLCKARVRKPRAAILRVSAPVIAAYLVGAFSVYGTAAVEARFGVLVLLAAGPLAVVGFGQLIQAPLSRRLVLAGSVATYTLLALGLSGWMRVQAPAIAAVEGLSRGNLALFRPVRQSSTFGPFGPEHGVDGIFTERGRFNGFHTENEPNPWWEVDLGKPVRVRKIRLFNAPPYERSAKLCVLLSEDGRSWNQIYDNAGRPFGGEPLELEPNSVPARYVRVQLRDKMWLHLSEVEVYGADPAGSR